MQTVYTLLVALAVGMLLKRLRVPGGLMVGAVVGACVLNLVFGVARMPPFSKTAAQVIAGAFVGSGVSRGDLRQMKTIFWPTVIVVLGLLTANILSGFLIALLSPLDLLTAFLCTTPGGISDVPIIAADMGADAAKVLVMQFVRYVTGIALFPTLIGKFVKPGENDGDPGLKPVGKCAADGPAVLLTLAAATAFGLLGKASGMPAGAMAFATLGSVGFKLLYPRAQLPGVVRKGAQVLSGAYVGAGIGLVQLQELRLLFLPALILFLSLCLGTLLISAVLVRRGVFSRREAMLASTPAGASDMALISADLGIRNARLILLQVLRMITVITFFPALFQLIVRWL